MQNILITLQIADDFQKAIMHSDVISWVICVSNEVEYLKKEKSKTRKLHCGFKRSLQCNQ